MSLTLSPEPLPSADNPQIVLPSIFAWRAHQTGLSSTAYFIVENSGNILIDSPPWTGETQDFLTTHGGVQHLLITHREAIAPTLRALQAKFDTQIWIQEQEAYLAPEVAVTPFQAEVEITPQWQGIWTPGYSPGSTCFYGVEQQLLFTGRHLLIDSQGQLQLLRRPKTFHWFRQLNSVAKLRDRFTDQTLTHICPGGHPLGRSPLVVSDRAYEQLAAWDLEQFRHQAALM